MTTTHCRGTRTLRLNGLTVTATLGPPRKSLTLNNRATSRHLSDEEDGNDLPDGSCFRRVIARSESKSNLNSRTAAIRPAKYMGSTPVTGLDQTSRAEFVRSHLEQLRDCPRSKPVLLVISLAGIKVCSPDGKRVSMAHALRRISYATCEPSHCQFSFLAREPKGHFSLQYCHSFVTKNAEQHTLTGHSDKVMAAKFIGEATKVVTGSYDRTLKIWDLRGRACQHTKFAGSSCNDLVTSDGSGSTIISGHFDKKIRFWDTRTESLENVVQLNGKITSLDISKDGRFLLACVRDDTLRIIDLRKSNTLLHTLSEDGLKISCDWARAVFSSDAKQVAVGSSDGSVFVLETTTNKVEVVLKDEHKAAVTAVAWHPYANFIASVGRNRQAVVWADL